MPILGRPRKNGLQPIWVLGRDTRALYAYERAREKGEKHCVAVSEAVKHVQQTAPWMPISETEVKRILSYWRPKGSTTGVHVSEPGPSGEILPVPVLRDGVISLVDCRVSYTASYGPRRTYARANAVLGPKEFRSPVNCLLS
jgi:hypothetical protein